MSAAQLERWRQWGLLPRATRQWQGKYGSASALPLGSVQVATVLGRHARRGRGWVDLALMAWLDHAPIRDAVLSRAVRESSRKLQALSQEVVQKEMQAHPVPEDLRLDPVFEQADALARLTSMRTREAQRMNRQMQARLRAAGYEVPEEPIRDMLIVTWSQMAGNLSDDEARQWITALGMEETPLPPSGRHAVMGWLIGRGLKELNGGISSEVLLAREGERLLAGEETFGRQELTSARSALRPFLDVVGIEPAERSELCANNLMVGWVAHMCALWVLVERRIPGVSAAAIVEAGKQVGGHAAVETVLPALAA